jgi:hypothetical protein
MNYMDRQVHILEVLELIQRKVQQMNYLQNIIFQKILNLTSTFYRTNMTDRIKIKSDWSGYENKIPDTTQEGIESEINVFFKK